MRTRPLRSRRGHIFTMDVMIGVIIIIFGLLIIFYRYPIKNTNYKFSDQLSNDVLEVLAETKLTDLCDNPGMIPSNGCDCYSYTELTEVVCQPAIKGREGNILSLFTEIIERGSMPKEAVEDIIEEIFIKKNVIDEKRFGFSIVYTTPDNPEPLELYNSEDNNP